MGGDATHSQTGFGIGDVKTFNNQFARCFVPKPAIEKLSDQLDVADFTTFSARDSVYVSLSTLYTSLLKAGAGTALDDVIQNARGQNVRMACGPGGDADARGQTDLFNLHQLLCATSVDHLEAQETLIQFVATAVETAMFWHMADSNPSSLADAFEAYDFEQDQTFLTGWDSLQRSMGADSPPSPEVYEKAKVFYFSKAFRSLDYVQYKRIRQEEGSGVSITGNGDPAKESDTMEANESSDATPYPRSFMELAEMVEKGLELPGVRKIDMTTQDDQPLPEASGAEAVPKKPWE